MKELECEEIRADWFGTRLTFTKDPDGRPIELKERKFQFLEYNPNDVWGAGTKKTVWSRSRFLLI